MSKNPQQTAYMYASSRVRALENGIVGKDRIEQLVNAAGMDEVYARLSEFGVELVKDADGCVLEEQTLDRIAAIAQKTATFIRPLQGGNVQSYCIFFLSGALAIVLALLYLYR